MPAVSMQTTLAKPTPLTVASVYRILRGIAAEKGSGSVGRKQRAVLQLLRSCRCILVLSMILP